MNQSELVSYISDGVERFTPDILQRKEDIEQYLLDIFRSIEVLPYYKLLSMHIETDESKLGYKEDDKGNKKRISNIIEIQPSRINEVTFTYKVNYKDEEEIVTRSFAIPKIINECFFDLKGSIYFPIYQIADRGTSTSKGFYSIKTLLMPIRMSHKQTTLTNINGETFNATDFRLHLFKRKLPYLCYYITKMGLEEAIKYFGLEWGEDLDYFQLSTKDIASHISIKAKLEEYLDTCYFFNINKNSGILIDKTKCITKNDFNLVQAIISYFKFMKTDDSLSQEEINYNFGSIFTKNNIEDKAKDVLFSFERLLDESSKKILVDISDEDKQDIYALIRWMVSRFEQDRFKDSMSLDNRRLQCWEYLLNPLLLALSQGAYRIINSRSLNMKTLCSIFNFSYMFLIKKIVMN